MTLQHYILTFQGSVLKDVKEDLDVVRNQHECRLLSVDHTQLSMTRMHFGQ